jgi:hypothetical protein
VDPNAAQSATQVAPRTDLLDLIELADGGARLAGGNRGEAPPLPDGFRILRAEELSLTAEAGSLARDADYRVLGHAGWAQTGVDTDRSVALDLKYLGLTNPAGTVEFYIGRRRHVIVDLSYFDGTASFWSAPVAPGIAPLVYAESYRLQQEGNDLGDALTYFDHPMFGVLILIERAPAPQNPNGGDSAGGPAA